MVEMGVMVTAVVIAGMEAEMVVAPTDWAVAASQEADSPFAIAPLTWGC
jgi:hypothetical protein